MKHATLTLPCKEDRWTASGRTLFRRRFQLSLRQCVYHGFSIEESFGLVWNEVREEVRLTEGEETELYTELIDWAKSCIKQGFIPDYSPELSTEPALWVRQWPEDPAQRVPWRLEEGRL